MNKKCYTLLIIAFFCIFFNSNAFAEKKTYQAKGEVVNTFSILSRITIKHDTIKGYAPAGETEFSLSSTDLSKNLSKGDLVSFVISEDNTRSQIDKIEKIGVAPAKEGQLPMGRTAQGILESTGEAAKTIVAPVGPAADVVGGAIDVTTNASGSVLNNVNPEHKDDF